MNDSVEVADWGWRRTEREREREVVFRFLGISCGWIFAIVYLIHSFYLPSYQYLLTPARPGVAALSALHFFHVTAVSPIPPPFLQAQALKESIPVCIFFSHSVDVPDGYTCVSTTFVRNNPWDVGRVESNFDDRSI